MPPDFSPRSPVLIETLIPGREWFLRVPDADRSGGYSRGELKRDAHGFLVWTGDVGEDDGQAAVRQRAEDDRGAE